TKRWGEWRLAQDVIHYRVEQNLVLFRIQVCGSTGGVRFKPYDIFFGEGVQFFCEVAGREIVGDHAVVVAIDDRRHFRCRTNSDSETRLDEVEEFIRKGVGVIEVDGREKEDAYIEGVDGSDDLVAADGRTNADTWVCLSGGLESLDIVTRTAGGKV